MKVNDLINYREGDQLLNFKRTDTRKPGLTLSHLNKLRKMREVEDLERMHEREQLEAVYGLVKDESNP